MKPDEKILFRFVNILELNVFIEGILDFSCYYCIIEKYHQQT